MITLVVGLLTGAVLGILGTLIAQHPTQGSWPLPTPEATTPTRPTDGDGYPPANIFHTHPSLEDRLAEVDPIALAWRLEVLEQSIADLEAQTPARTLHRPTPGPVPYGGYPRASQGDPATPGEPYGPTDTHPGVTLRWEPTQHDPEATRIPCPRCGLSTGHRPQCARAQEPQPGARTAPPGTWAATAPVHTPWCEDHTHPWGIGGCTGVPVPATPSSHALYCTHPHPENTFCAPPPAGYLVGGVPTPVTFPHTLDCTTPHPVGTFCPLPEAGYPGSPSSPAGRTDGTQGH